jgi:superfamily II DNA or RNA helicase
MHELLKLRDYQRECIRDLHSRWDAGAWRVPSVLATGLGKTVIFAHLAEQFLADTPGKRVLILAHTDELVNQAASKMKQTAPHRTVGIVKAERNEVSAHVIVASVQSLRNKKRREQLRNVGLIIVDECHHAVATTYRSILEHFGAFPSPCSECNGTGVGGDEAVPNGGCWDCRGTGLYNGGECSVKVAGFTATLARGDKKKLSEVWEACTFTRGISFGIRRGYLLDVRGKRVVVPDFDISNVKKSAGDYADGDLARELERSLAPEIVAEAYVKNASDRKGVAFWPTVELAQLGAEAFNAAGIPSETIYGMLDRDPRRSMLRRLASGATQVVHGVAVLTEGFDDPTISCIVIARPTQSAPLYQQMVGRGLRPNLALASADRGDCLVLDVVGASRNHDLRSLVDLSEKEIREEIAEDEVLSLLDMEEQEEALAEDDISLAPPEEELYNGATEHVDFDPLGRTTIGAWMQTSSGYYFLPASKEAYVLIVPSEEPSTFDVAWLTQSARTFWHRECSGMPPYFSNSRSCRCGGHAGSPGGLTEHRGMSVEMACSWAEEVMEDMGGSFGSKRASWRRRPITANQKFTARNEGIEITEDMRQGELSDRLGTIMATRRIDPVVTFMLKARESN